ncbi:MAG TPA: UPF0182 family protein [Mycobacteriales bacterium]|nr:UPF0182 family protein [Mycobacteriales bacterium]
MGGAALLIAAIGYTLNALVGIDTNLLWFRAIGHESAYTRRFWTQALLFATFAALMAAATGHTLVVVVRQRPDFNPDPTRQRWRYVYSRLERRLRKGLFAVIVVVLAVQTGSAAASGWQTWLLWRNAVPFHTKDPQFHRDISYFLFTFPLHRMVLTLLFRIVGTAIVTLLVVGYAYGAVRLRGKGPRLTRSLQIHLSVLLAIYLGLKAFAYWLDRLATATSNRGVVTGPSYTDIHAVIPGKLALVIVAAICAVVMFANIAVQSNRLLVGTIGVMAGCALVGGIIVPRLVQQFWDKPSASTVEAKYIGRNIAGTRTAFGLNDDVAVSSLPGSTAVTGKALLAQAKADAQIRLLDPNRVSPTFTVLQQQRSFYGFKSTLDVDHYAVAGRDQDVEIALRELNLSGLPKSQQSWTNQHLVYTHGYGVVAAPTDAVHNGQPQFVAGDVPQRGLLPVTQPRIYYGQSSPSYSIVGGSGKGREIDRPSTSGSGDVTTTHTGGGGVPIGTFFHRLLYAWKLGSSSILFSSEIHSDSQLLYNRNPRARVAAVAPWLTLDGDTYPVVVDGQVDWVVDGYTTSNNYPYSQQVNLRSATSTTLTKSGSSVIQPNTSVNYMRNSVKAVVNAYSGAVTLYAWNQSSNRDPVLATWEKAFPGLVKSQDQIPAALLPHLRYPTDLFNVQRSLLARYHVTNPHQFYSGSDFWKVPNDPTVPNGTTTNALGKKVSTPAPPQPSAYFTMSATGNAPPPPPSLVSPLDSRIPTYSLSSPLVTLNRRNLAAFLSVDAEPGPNYGHFTLLELPSTAIVDAPSQIQNAIESTPRIATALSLERSGNSKVVLGNLLALPLAGQILYVEPIYTQSTGGSPFPILRHVAAVYGNGPVGFGSTLDEALSQAFGIAPTPAPTATTPATTNPG